MTSQNTDGETVPNNVPQNKPPMIGMKEYKGFLMDFDNDHNVQVLTQNLKIIYNTGRKGNAVAFIDGITFDKELLK